MMNLYPYQQEGVEWLRRRKSGLLAFDPGCGKTAVTLSSLPSSNPPVIVVCPRIARGVWEAETALWRPQYSVKHIRGRKAFRWPERGELLTVTYDGLPTEPGTCPRHGDTVFVLDEAHCVKNASAMRTKATKKVADAVEWVGGRVVGLTGTPVVHERPEELWCVLDVLGCGGSPATFASAFGGQYIRRRNGTGEWVWDGPMTPDAHKRLTKVMLRKTREECLPDLPEATYQDIVCEWSPDARSLCAELDRALKHSGFCLEDLAETINGGERARDFDISVLSRTRSAIAASKVPHLLQYVELMEANETPLVVFSAHQSPVVSLEGREGWATITGDTPERQRTRIVADFQAGRLKGLASTIKACGVAVTLTRGHHCLFVDREWSPALNSQAVDRLRRIGQRNCVHVASLVYDHPVEMMNASACLRKSRFAEVVVG